MYSLSVSKKEIARAGERICHCIQTNQPYDEKDTLIMHEWRMLHLYPLQKITEYLEREAKDVNKNALISSRIKRLPSITGKLIRFPEMKLHKMQDLGGCRAIVNDIEQVNKIKDRILNLTFMHELKRVDDYIQKTKDSGYRSIHIVHAFYNKKYPQLNGLKIETQIRTTIQHSWATAVEMVGIFRRESLKSSMGDQGWLRFFILVSNLFYLIESKDKNLSRSHNNISDELKKLTIELNAFKVLNAFSHIAEHINNSDRYSSGLCVISVDTEQGAIEVTGFSGNNFHQKASAFYMETEQSCTKGNKKVAAMVSVNSVNELKTAYPAFFLDTKTFLNNLSRFIFT